MNHPDPNTPGAAHEADRFDALPLRWLLLALVVWVGLAVLLAALQHQQQQVPPTGLVLLSRMRALLGESIIFFLGPVGLLLLIWLLAGLVLRRWEATLVEALATGLRVGSMLFAASAVLWAGMAGWSFMQGNDPWEGLPGVTPPYLSDFLARHPGFEASTYGGTRQLFLHDGHGHSVFVDGDDVAGAQVRFDPCPPREADQALLGGIPPYPGAKCSTLLRIRRGDVERVTYVFEAVRDDNLDLIRGHFTRWAEALGAQNRFRGGPNQYFFDANKGNTTWDLRLYSGRGRATAIYIPQDGRTQAWAGKDAAAQAR